MEGTTPQKATLKDLIAYKPDEYLTDEDKEIVRTNFKDGNKLLRVIRKILLPTVSDPNLPIEEFGKDLWFAGVDFSQLSKEEVQQRVIARADAIRFVMGGLIYIKQLAAITEESPVEAAYRKAKDSNK